jgi:hypothetical protein
MKKEKEGKKKEREEKNGKVEKASVEKESSSGYKIKECNRRRVEVGREGEGDRDNEDRKKGGANKLREAEGNKVRGEKRRSER